MPIFLDGLVHVTGESDVGKSTFAVECGAHPSRIAFFDFDLKGQSIARELNEVNHPFGAYHDLVTETKGMRELELHNYCLDLIDSIKPNQYDAIIWDTWEPFAKTCHPYVVKNPSQFRLVWSPMGTIKGAQQWNAAFDYEASLIAQLCSITRLVILTSHLKSAYRGNKRIPDKFVPDCSRAIVRKARLRIWLRRNPASPQPIGLILKRLSLPAVTDRGIRVTNVLPLRMNPCTWDEIAKYMENPIGDRDPLGDELPDEYELSLLQNTLTADQERTFRMMLRADALGYPEEGIEEESEQVEQAESPPTTWQELLDRTRMTPEDLGGVAKARAMTEEEIREKWEGWGSL